MNDSERATAAAAWQAGESLTVEKLQEALGPYRKMLRVERIVRTIAEAPSVEVKPEAHTPKGSLYVLDPKRILTYPGGDEPVYVVCHPDHEATAHEVIRTIREATDG